jgi:hypothetical protein
VSAVSDRVGQVAGRALISRSEFVSDVRYAAANRVPFAAGKLGISEKRWMYYPLFLEREREVRKIKAYEASLCFHALKQSGLFPADPQFYAHFARLYVDDTRSLDCIGVFNDSPFIEPEIIRSYGLTAKLTYFINQEPDRSSPADPELCYLPGFAGKKILLLSPFAELLRERATRDVFESVWARTGKEWFYPASVQAIEFPYGFARATQQRYKTSLDLLKSVEEKISAADFDIALIAAGGLGIPLAAFVKSLGKVGLSLGGHLQILFGVLGDRWRGRANWQDRYFNSAWIDMPERYRPADDESHENYW